MSTWTGVYPALFQQTCQVAYITVGFDGFTVHVEYTFLCVDFCLCNQSRSSQSLQGLLNQSDSLHPK